MFITFNCSQCHGSLEIDVSGVGAHVTCPHCQAAITVPQTDLGPGTTIGEFKISAKLGEGGMGEVYLARQISMDRNVALKILPATLSRQKDLSARFLNEVKLLAKLEHPHIVMAYGAGEDAGVLFLAMTYVEGESLEARLKREGPFSERSALAIARKLALALSYAWNKHQLLHRDIKPSNVLLDRDGEPKLADFGLAKSLSADTALTMTNMLIGTPNYMSPEQIEGSAQVDTRADMYSLGALLYNLVTGEVPFAGTSVMEVLRKQIAEPLPDPREFNAELSEGCVILMENMLAKDRDERPGSWEAVIADIDRVVDEKSPTKALPEMGASTLIRIRDVKRLAEVKGRGPRSVKTGGKPGPGPVKSQKNKARMKAWAWAGAGVGILVLIVGGIALVLGLSAKSDQAEGRARASGPAGALHSGAATTNQSDGQTLVSGPADAARRDTATVSTSSNTPAKVTQAYLAALEYVSSHAEDFDGSIGRLEEVRKDGAGTEYAQKAGEQIRRLEAEKRRKVDAAWRGLKQAAEKLADQKQYAKGILLLEQYAGLYAAELASDRKQLAEEWTAKDQAQKDEKAKQQAEKEEKKQKAEVEAAEKGRQAAAQTNLNAATGEAAQADETRQRLNGLLDNAAEDILKQDLAGAEARLRRAQADAKFAAVANELAAAAQFAQGLGDGGDLILKSFESQKGQAVRIQMHNGTMEEGTVLGVAGGKVRLSRTVSGGMIEKPLAPANLSPQEKQRRLGDAKNPATMTMRGLLALEAKDRAGAEALFAAAGALEEAGQSSGVAAALARVMKMTTAEGRELVARQALQALVKMAGVTNAADTNLVVQAVGDQTYSSNQVVKIQAAVAEFRKHYGETAATKTNAALLEALAAVSVTPVGFMAVNFGGGVKLEMVWIKPGSFMMGAGAEAHRVRLSKGFWMGKYEVTQEQWEKIMGNKPSSFKGANLPVENVSWNDCQEFLKKLNALFEKRKGKLGNGEFRLPTEAQWEYACRAGTRTVFYTGDADGDLDRAGWYQGNAGGATHTVGQKEKNAWGLYDMHGNVWEWCEDWFGPYAAGDATDPTGPSVGSTRVLRGGSWDHATRFCLSAYRYNLVPTFRNFNIGFRVVVSHASP